MRLFSTVLAILFIALSVSAFSEPQIVTDVKNGTKALECLFSDGWRDIPKDKVIGIDDINGHWIFTNGSAKTCEVY